VVCAPENGLRQVGRYQCSRDGQEGVHEPHTDEVTLSRSLLLRPDVEEFTLPLFEALAECVRKIISERTKAALAGTGPRQPPAV
jgi:hypothetical protein